ncbi:MAG: sensor histidine kinase [Saprospiraceae bacterium]|nr:sensor histidine kinase [Saprospiraceae bacterium]
MKNLLTVLFSLLSFACSYAQYGQKTLDSLKNLLSPTYSDTTRLRAYNRIGDWFQDTNQDSSIYYFTKGLELIKNKNYPHIKAEIIENLAYSYYRNGELEKAIELNFETLQIAQNLKDERLSALAFHNLGLVFTDKEEYEKAIAYLKKAVQINEKLANKQSLAANLNPLGGVYFSLEKYDSALIFFKQSFNINKELKREVGQGIASSNIGAIYYMKGDYDAAINSYQTALNIQLKLQTESNLPVSMSNLGEAYIAKGNFTEGLKLYDQAMFYVERAKEYNFRSEMYKMYADAYVKKGDYKLAYDYFVKFKMAKDSLAKKKYNKNVAEIETKYESAKKDKEIAEQKAQNFRQRTWFIALLVGLGLLIILAYLFYNRRQMRQKASFDAALIREQQLGLNAVIEAQELERQRIAKELHDGIAQELVALKLGFDKLGKKIKTIAPEETPQYERLKTQLDESCTEVRNIAHVMLPPTLETSGLVLALEMLLRNSLEQNDIQTEFEHFDMPDSLEKKKELGLYRIAQELINNIIKHAHANKVILQLYKTGNQLIMRMEDNGLGFDFDAVRQADSLGLLNILSRVSNLGGSFSSEKGVKLGTISTVRVPL